MDSGDESTISASKKLKTESGSVRGPSGQNGGENFLATTQKLPVIPPNRRKSRKTSTGTQGINESQAATSGSSGGLQNQKQSGSTQSQLEFRTVVSPGSNERKNGGLAASSSSIPKPRASSGPSVAPLATSSAPPPVTAHDETLANPTQPWVEPADGDAPAISPSSPSILELTPAKPSRNSRSAAAKQASKAAASSSRLTDSPMKRTPGKATIAKRAGSKSTLAPVPEVDDLQRDVGSLDIMPTQPFPDQDDLGDDLVSSAPRRPSPHGAEPFIPASQMQTAPEQPLAPFLGTRGAMRRAAAVPPSPIVPTDTPAGLRRRSSRLGSQSDMEATIVDPKKYEHLAQSAGLGPLAPSVLNFDAASTKTGTRLSISAPVAPPKRPAVALGSPALTRRGNPRSRRSGDDDASEVSYGGISNEELSLLLKREREETMTAVQEALEQTALRLENVITSKVEQIIKSQRAAFAPHVEEMKKHLSDLVRIEVRTAFADSRPLQAEEAAIRPQHVQAVVESLTGVEKMISAWKNSLAPSVTPANAQKQSK